LIAVYRKLWKIPRKICKKYNVDMQKMHGESKISTKTGKKQLHLNPKYSKTKGKILTVERF